MLSVDEPVNCLGWHPAPWSRNTHSLEHRRRRQPLVDGWLRP